MKKRFVMYGVIWAICLAVFNVIAFVTPNEIGGVSKFNGSFWTGYVFITVAFIAQLVCALISLKEKKIKKLFYKLSVSFVNYCGLVAILAVGGIFMLFNELPTWLGIIICFVILAFNVISVIKANTAAEIVYGIDEKNKDQTLFMKELTVKAQTLMSSAASDRLKAEAKRVYEAIRYSNHMSHVALDDLNLKLEREFVAFSDAVNDGDAALAKAIANTLVSLVEKRNAECKLVRNKK